MAMVCEDILASYLFYASDFCYRALRNASHLLAVPTAAERSEDMAHRWKVLAVTSIGLFMASLDLFIVNIAFPDLSRSFDDVSLSSLSWVLNGYAIVFAALLVPAGRIADRVGRKRVFITGLLTFSFASALCAVAPSIPFLVAARVLQAAGAAMMIPTTLGLLLPAFPVEQRPVAI